MQWGIVYTTWSIIVCYDIRVRGEYIGCYEETSDLYEYHGIREMEVCRSDCSDLRKTYYVVRRRGNSDNIECHCADRLPEESTDEFGCNRDCGGECGGPRSHSIYSVCDRGYWGWSCGSICYCEGNDVCQKRTGLCPESYEDIGCFSSEILQDSIVEDIHDNSDKKGYCRKICISHESGYFAVVTNTDKCHCIKNSPYSHRKECPSANLLRKLLAIDSFIIIYTVCPVGSYSTNGIDCNQYCSCPGDSNQSGLCVYDSDSGTEVCEECTGGWQGELCAEDVNECDSDDHGCEGDCVNMPGSYHCTCPDGMQLTADYRTCVNIITGPSDSHKGLSNTTIAIIAAVVGVLMENTNYESQEMRLASDDKRPTSDVIILDNTNYESQDLANNKQRKENVYCLAKETRDNYHINNVSADSQTVVVNGDVYNLRNKPQNIYLKEDGTISAEDSKITDIDKSTYSSATEGVGAGDDKGAYNLAKNPVDPDISRGAYSLVKNPEDTGDSDGVYNLPKNPDNCDVKEDTNVRMNESEKIVNGDIYRLPNKQNKDQPQ